MTLLRSVLATLAIASLLSAAAPIPRKSPEFVVTLPGGRQTLLSKYRGKVVALGIILTTCPHCQKMCTVLNDLYRQHRADGFEPLIAALDDDSDVAGFARQLGLRFPVGTTPRPQAYDYIQKEFHYVPQLVLIDRTGTIRAVHEGGDDFFRDEEKNLRELVTSLLGKTKTARR